VKNIGKELFERYGDKFTEDFRQNKEIIKQLVEIKSKKLKNVVAGYVTSLKKQRPA